LSLTRFFRNLHIPENQNYLNYQQGQQQGRFLSSFPQSSRNGFFPVQRQGQQQPQQAGSYQQQDLYLDGPSTPYFNSYQPFAVSCRCLIGFGLGQKFYENFGVEAWWEL
jgi:hypothetical protein